MTLEPTVVAAIVAAATGAIGYVFGQLWGVHKDSDADVRGQRDLGWAMAREATAAVRALADELEQERRDRAVRHRAGDG